MTPLEGYARYAIYFAPEPGSALERVAAAVLGRDGEGRPTERVRLEGLPGPLEQLTREAARYGFHGTLKAPFRLRAGATAEALAEAIGAFAAERTPLAPIPLRLAQDHGFLSLRPDGPAPALDALAFDVVRAFEPFRAPLEPAEIARRRASGLTPRQDALLLEWGYPYVADQFGFHLTLTERIEPAPARAAVAAALSDTLAPALAEPMAVAALWLFGDPGAGGHFTRLRRFPLGA